VTLFDVSVFALHAAVASLAVVLAGRRREHVPVAIFLAADAFIEPLRFVIFDWLTVPGPYEGSLRALFHADQAAFLSWPIGIAAVSTRVFMGRHARGTLAVGALAWLGLVLGYPVPFRGEMLARAYAIIAAASIAWVLVGAIVWTPRREHPRPWHACVTLLGALNIPLYFDTWFAPFERWGGAQVVFAVLWVALLAVHGGAIWASFMLAPRPGSRSPSP